MKPYLNDVMFVVSSLLKSIYQLRFSTRPIKRKSPVVRKPAVAAKRKRQESSAEGLSINLMCLRFVFLLVWLL